MAEPVPVVLAKEGVSDDSFLFLAALKAEGDAAEAGEVIARVETSKASLDICAPCPGHVFFRYRVGQEVPVGGTLAVIAGDRTFAGGASGPAATADSIGAAPAGDGSAAAATAGSSAGSSAGPSAAPSAGSPPRRDPPASAPPDADSRMRFTPLARKMIAEFNLDENGFSGTGLVRKDAVLEAVKQRDASGQGYPVPAGAKPRFSLAAAAEVERHGLAAEAFAGYGLVTREDVRRKAGLDSGPAVPRPAEAAAPGNRSVTREAPPAVPAPAAGIRVPLSKAKRNEILSLQDGQAGALSSAITILVSGRGCFDPATRTASPTLLPALVYEASRLLAEFPDFNARYEDHNVVRWEAVNVGVAFEIDAGLKVPVVKGADRLGLDEIRAALDAYVLKYLENGLGLEDLTGATFTVTDLSGDQVFDFLPLINRGQSAILGMGGCQVFSDTESAFPLTLAFDHRVSTGRQASRFLRALKERLESYAAVLETAQAAPRRASRSCCLCRREEGELRDRQFLLAIHRGGRPDHVCSTCFKGW